MRVSPPGTSGAAEGAKLQGMAPPGYRILGEPELAALRDPARSLADAVLLGLAERPKRLPSRFFYDARGSELFEEIMELEEYYPTRCEDEILTREAPALAAALAARAPLDVIDLGAGDGAKTIILLRALVAAGATVRYRPIDISESAMSKLVGAVASALPAIELAGIVSEYSDGLHWLAAQPGSSTKLVLFLGSNIGNFDRPRARAFLRRLWLALCEGDQVLIGFDLKKDIDVLLRAYNDSCGVTAAFNLNLLTRINSELGGSFDLSRFRHFGTYDVFSGAMESYLVSLERQVVSIEALSQTFSFEPWEPVHTEYSYKYLRTDIHSLAENTGFTVASEHIDSRGWFVDSLWTVTRPI